MLDLDHTKSATQAKLDAANRDHNLYGTILHTPSYAPVAPESQAWIEARYAETIAAIAALTDELAVLNGV